MRHTLLKTMTAFCTIFMIACCTEKPSSTENTGDTGDPETPVEEPGDYPHGVSVEEFRDDFQDGTYCSGFIATVDFNENPDLKFNVSYNVPKKTPSEIYDNFRSDTEEPAIVINGGYFAGTTSMSLAVIDGSARCNNATSINWPNDEQYQCTVYPVRSAIGQMDDGSFEIQWTYCVDQSSRKQTAFPSALDNDEQTQTFMKEPPTAEAYNGIPWNPEEAVGGGPRIVQKGQNVAEENYWAEVLDSGGTAGLSRQPRTGIGYTEDGKLIMIVCDGRGMNGSSGFTLSELAEKFITLGAVDAMNLDGGGSSAMVGKDGTVLNRPSDSGNSAEIVERKIVTAIVITEMQK